MLPPTTRPRHPGQARSHVSSRGRFRPSVWNMLGKPWLRCKRAGPWPRLGGGDIDVLETEHHHGIDVLAAERVLHLEVLRVGHAEVKCSR